MPSRFSKNMFNMLQNLVKNNVFIFTDTGAPTNGTSGTLATFAGAGSLYIDNTSAVGIVYINQNTKASPTWVAIGTTLPGSITLATGSVLVGTAGVAAALNAKTSGQILIGNGTTVVSVAITGDVTITSGGVTAIGAGKVLNSMLAATAITEGVTVANTFTTASLATGVLQRVTGNITSANITGTSAGQLGHANGVVLQAAPGANISLQLVDFSMHYTYSTAAYTGGGDDVSVRWGAGGAAISGVIAKANMLGAAASKSAFFVPLAVTATPNVSNASLNLVATTAYTQPGTAAGTVAWELWYRTQAVGF